MSRLSPVRAFVVTSAILLTGAAQAQTPRSLAFNPTQTFIPNVNDSAVVALSIDNPSQLNAYDFTIQYDSTVVQATDATVPSPFTSCFNQCSTPGPTPPVGRVICSFGCQTPVPGATPVNLVNITFKGQQGNGANSPLQVTNCGLAILQGTAETPVPCTPGSGNIVVGFTVTSTPTPTSTPTLTSTATNTPTGPPPPTGTATPTGTSTPTSTATNSPTVTPTATITSTAPPTATTSPTGTRTPSFTESPTRTVTSTTTATPTTTPTATSTASPTTTSTRTPTNTTTVTPTATATNTLTPTPLQTPVITGGARSGSTSVTGRAIPNPNPNTCISIFDCGSDACGSANDVLIGTGGVDGAGNFVVTVTTLRTGERIYPKDTCNPGALTGPVVVVQPSGEIPDVSGWGAVLLAVSLVLAIGVKLRLASFTTRQQP